MHQSEVRPNGACTPADRLAPHEHEFLAVDVQSDFRMLDDCASDEMLGQIIPVILATANCTTELQLGRMFHLHLQTKLRCILIGIKSPEIIIIIT
eukprot:scaffold183832_cov50-Prasinocladus_malaysianus.AAC.1